MAQNPTPGQINNYQGAQATGTGIIYDALGNPRVVGANMQAGAGSGKALVSDSSGNLTLGSVGAASLPAATTTTQGAVILDGTAADIAPDGTQAAGSSGKAADAAHVHPENEGFIPSDFSYLTWAFEPASFTAGSVLPTGGQIFLSRINVRQPISVTNVVYYVGAAGTTLTSGQCFVGLYNSSGTLIGTSADQAANFGGTGLVTAALANGPYSVSTGFVWAAFLFNGTTGPGIERANNITTAAANLSLGVAAARSARASLTSQTVLTSFTPANNVLTAPVYWAALS